MQQGAKADRVAIHVSYDTPQTSSHARFLITSTLIGAELQPVLVETVVSNSFALPPRSNTRTFLGLYEGPHPSPL